MTAIVLDTDIAAAAASTTPGSLALDKINAQAYRNALASLTTHQQALIANEQVALDLARQQVTPSLRQTVMLALVDKFMAKSSSTVPATYTAASVLDGQKMRAAIDEAIKAAAP